MPIQFRCVECKESTVSWSEQCFSCAKFHTLYSERVRYIPLMGESPRAQLISKDASMMLMHEQANRPMMLEDAMDIDSARTKTLPGVDDVLGGGLVDSSVILLAGPPGIGKSTLVLHVLHSLVGQGVPVFYGAGEETLSQIKVRGKRLEVDCSKIVAMKENDLEALIDACVGTSSRFLVVDSVNTAICPGIPGQPGSPSQIKAVANRLVSIAKGHGITTLLIGHATKEDDIAGPRSLEHLVDCCIFFNEDEEEREMHGIPKGEKADGRNPYRVLYVAGKNRFGNSAMRAKFEMTEKGLIAHSCN